MTNDEENARKDLEVLREYMRSKLGTTVTTIGVCEHARFHPVDIGWAVEKMCLGCGHVWMSVREPGATPDQYDLR